jgi:hypothetical protein
MRVRVKGVKFADDVSRAPAEPLLRNTSVIAAPEGITKPLNGKAKSFIGPSTTLKNEES